MPKDAAQRGVVGFLKAVFNAPRCDQPAVFLTPLGDPVCAACGQEMKSAHEAGHTALAIFSGRRDFPLTPLQ